MPGAGPWSALRIAPVATRALSRGPGNLLCPAGDILRDPRYRDVGSQTPELDTTLLSEQLCCLSRSHSSSRSHSHSHPRLRSGFVSITLHTPRPARVVHGLFGADAPRTNSSRIRSLGICVGGVKWSYACMDGDTSLSCRWVYSLCLNGIQSVQVQVLLEFDLPSLIKMRDYTGSVITTMILLLICIPITGPADPGHRSTRDTQK